MEYDVIRVYGLNPLWATQWPLRGAKLHPPPPPPHYKTLFTHRDSRLKFGRQCVHTKWNTMIGANNDKGCKAALVRDRRLYFSPSKVLNFRLPAGQYQG